MGEIETVFINDTIKQIRATMDNLKEWADGNPSAEPRHVAMVISKLEEAELLAQRIVKF